MCDSDSAINATWASNTWDLNILCTCKCAETNVHTRTLKQHELTSQHGATWAAVRPVRVRSQCPAGQRHYLCHWTQTAKTVMSRSTKSKFQLHRLVLEARLDAKETPQNLEHRVTSATLCANIFTQQSLFASPAPIPPPSGSFQLTAADTADRSSHCARGRSVCHCACDERFAWRARLQCEISCSPVAYLPSTILPTISSRLFEL